MIPFLIFLRMRKKKLYKILLDTGVEWLVVFDKVPIIVEVQYRFIEFAAIRKLYNCET